MAITTGISRSAGEAFIRRSRSIPLTPGSITSSTTSAGFSCSSAAQNEPPSAKPRASSPVDCSAYTSMSRMLSSSSTHQIIKQSPPRQSALCTPVIEKITHSAMFTAWSPIRSKYFAIISRSSAYSPSSGFAAILPMSARLTCSK